MYREGIKEAIRQENRLQKANAEGQKELMKKAWTAQLQHQISTKKADDALLRKTRPERPKKEEEEDTKVEDIVSQNDEKDVLRAHFEDD